MVTAKTPRWVFASVLTATAMMSAATSCPPVSSRGDAKEASAGPQPAVIGAREGERRFLRGGTAPLLIKIDPVTTGSRRMVLGMSDLPPGDSIGVHRHLREDEIVFITRGTARVQLGNQHYMATAGGTVFIPQGTCIAVANAGADTLTVLFVFSSPGPEQVLRDVSSPEGAPPKTVSPAERASAFRRGHAEASPSDC
jgi:quercetin dioxygenase-like cupin family protein